MKPYLGAFALVLLASSAVAQVAVDDKLTRISGLLTRASLICADFTQTKTLRALNRPLRSSGRVAFLADKGILWQVKAPFPTRLLVKKDALIKWTETGEPQRIGFEQSPIFGTLARVFMAVFTGEIDPLNKNFEVQSRIRNSLWRLTLTPRDENLAKIFARIHASGGRFVNQLRIEERRGDQTRIDFANIKSDSCQLTNSETGYFAQ